MLRKIILYSLLLLSYNFALSGLQDQIKAHADSIWHSNNDTTRMLRSIDNSWNYRTLNIDSALFYSQLAEKINTKLDLQNVQAKIFNIRGSLFHMSSNFDSAKYYYNRSIELRNPKNYMGNASTYMNMVNVYSESGMYEAANIYLNKAKSLLDSTLRSYDIKNIKEAVKLQEKYRIEVLSYYKKNKTKHDSVFNYYKPLNTYVTSYYSIFLTQGDMKYNSKNYEEAIYYYDKCISYLYNYPRDSVKIKNHDLDHVDFIIHAFYKKASALFSLGRYDKALINYNIAERNSFERGDLLTYALTQSYKARINAIQKQYSVSKIQFKKATDYFIKLDHTKGIIDNTASQIEYLFDHLSNKEMQTLFENYKQQLNNYNNPTDIISEINVNRTKYLVAKKLNDFEEAINYLEIYNKLEDSVRSALNKTKIIEQQELLNLKDIKNDLEYKSRVLSTTQEENEKLNIYLILSIIILVLILVFSFLLFRNYKKIETLNKELLKVTTKKEELFSILAHDIRSPITLTSKALRMMSEKDLDEERKQLYIEQISDAIFRVENLVQSILEWIISESNKQLLETEEFNIKDLVEQSLYDLDQRINAKNISLELELSNISIEADKLSTTLIISNILQNAIKFSNPSSTLIIQLSSNTFTVINTGTQLDPNQLNDITNLGKTYSKDGTSGEKGSGLGLTIINNLSNYNGFKFSISNHENHSVRSTLKF